MILNLLLLKIGGYIGLPYKRERICFSIKKIEKTERKERKEK
jgi:hypothetical protein